MIRDLRTFGACAATLLLVLGGPAGADRASAQRTPPSSQRTFASAVQLYEQRLYADAMTAFDAYRQMDPENVLGGQSLYLEGRSALAQNRDEEAIRLFREFQNTYPSHPRAAEAQLSLAQRFLDEGKTEAARDQLQSIIENPNTPSQAARGLYLFGQSERERGNLEEALTYFQRVRTEYANTDVAPAAFYALGATHVRLERYDAAAASFEELGRKYPESPFAQNLGTALAEVYYRLEQYDEAAAELRDRLDQLQGRQRARALFLLAESANHLGRGEDAVVNYRRVIDDYSETPYAGPARYGLAWHYFQEKEHSEAADAFARVGQNAPAPLPDRATYYEAVSRALAGDTARALELYQRVAEQQPDTRFASEALFEAGLLRYQQQNYDSAAAFFRTLIRDHPEAPRVGDAYYWLGNAYLVNESLDRALKAYTQATKRDSAPDSLLVEVRFQKAWAQYEEERFSEAGTEFLSLVDAHPNTPRGREALFWGADCFYRRGNYNRARSLFQRYLNEHPDGNHASGARYALAWTYFKQTQFESAARYFRQFLDRGVDRNTDIPYEQDARLRLADSYFALNRYEDALDVYRRIRGQGSGYALYQAGEALNYAGRPGEALRTLRRFTEQHPESPWHPDALYRIGTILFQQQDYEAAVEAYERFLEVYPNHQRAPRAQYGIGDSYYNAGAMKKAVNAYRTVLETYPDDAAASEAASSLFFALNAAGQSDRADDLIDSLARQHPDANFEDRLRFHRAKAAYQSGNSETALNLFQQFVRTSSTSSLLPDAYYHLGLLYANEDADTEAKNYLQQLVDEHPDSEVMPEGALRLGDIYMDEEAYSEAARTYQAAAESDAITNELRAQARYGQSMALLNLDQNEKARALLNDILENEETGPLRASARLGLARISENENQPAEARKLYRSVVESTNSETGAEALYRLGRLLRRENSPRTAIEELDRMSALFAGYPEWIARSLIEQARAYRQLGQTGQAAQLYDEVINSYPGTPFAETATEEREEL